MDRHRALALCLGMTFSENRFTLFRTMPQETIVIARHRPTRWRAMTTDCMTAQVIEETNHD
jgi:hypothetical protein